MLARTMATLLALSSSPAHAQRYSDFPTPTDPLLFFAVIGLAGLLIGAVVWIILYGSPSPPPRRLTPEELAEETRYLHAEALHMDARASFDDRASEAALKREERAELEEFLRQQRQKRHSSR